MTGSPLRRLRALRREAFLFTVLLFPVSLRGQFANDAMSSFARDTQQVAYANYAQLRSSPDYPQLHNRILNRQLRYFQDFLRATGVDPDKDVDEVMLGWRGEAAGTTGFFGLAQGRFQPDKVRAYYAESQLPVQSYAGTDLYAFGSGQDPGDVFFTFLDTSRAAFGPLADLKALLDVRQGSANGLDTNPSFSSWENELEGTAPQWGIINGKAAANLAAGWFTAGPPTASPGSGRTTERGSGSQGGLGSSGDLSALLSPVRAVLYRVEWDGGFSSHLALICQDDASAATLLKLISLLQAASQQPAANSASTSSVSSILQSMEAHQSGSRVELSVSGPMDALDQVLGSTLR